MLLVDIESAGNTRFGYDPAAPDLHVADGAPDEMRFPILMRWQHMIPAVEVAGGAACTFRSWEKFARRRCVPNDGRHIATNHSSARHGFDKAAMLN
jgi:hypothetical protein